jgi:hypothetical protein
MHLAWLPAFFWGRVVPPSRSLAVGDLKSEALGAWLSHAREARRETQYLGRTMECQVACGRRPDSASVFACRRESGLLLAFDKGDPEGPAQERETPPRAPLTQGGCRE